LTWGGTAGYCDGWGDVGRASDAAIGVRDSGSFPSRAGDRKPEVVIITLLISRRGLPSSSISNLKYSKCNTYTNIKTNLKKYENPKTIPEMRKYGRIHTTEKRNQLERKSNQKREKSKRENQKLLVF